MIDTSVLGVLLTLIVCAIDYAGGLFRVEQLAYDLRAQHFQIFTPPPTTQLVHVDIDDVSLTEIGHWPWPRATMALLIDEIRLAGAKALGLDVIWTENDSFDLDDEAVRQAIEDQEGLAKRSAAGLIDRFGGASTRPGSLPYKVTLRIPDGDAMFAESLRRMGRAVVPMSLNLNERSLLSPEYRALVNELRLQPDLKEDEAVARAVARLGLKTAPGELRSKFPFARGDAIFDRIEIEMRSGAVDFDGLRKRIFPNIDPNFGGSVEINALREQFARYESIRSLRRFARPFDAKLPPLINTNQDQATIRVLADAAHSSGYVDYVPMADGKVRMVPLLASHRDWVFTQFGLALACEMLDVDLKKLIVQEERVIIPCPDGRRIELPVRTTPTARGTHGMFFDIPWWGKTGDGWMTMYDFPAHQQPKQHMKAVYLFQPINTQRKIYKNNDRAMDALIFYWAHTEEARAKQLDQMYKEGRFDFNNPDVLLPLVDEAVAKIENAGIGPKYWQDMNPADLRDDNERLMRLKWIAVGSALPSIRRENEKLKQELADIRADLKKHLDGKAVLVGYTAVGAIADFVPTPLHARCPGVVAHGAIFNSIMINDVWRRTSHWVSVSFTVAMGLLTTFFISRLATWKALTATILLLIGYSLLNGLVLFDYFNLIIGAAAPLAAAVLVWAGGTLARYWIEQSERTRVTRAFGKYVDPALVSYVLEGDARLDGQEKELTVVFTDLAGFTTMSERLKADVVPLLNEYMGLMVPVIRRHNGYLNKFLGDGIMYFFGAPLENSVHATGAVASVLEMQEVMRRFNSSLTERGLPTLAVRAGISSGKMIVGDAGSIDSPDELARASDYTVLGDNVNLGARLEAANKAFGTTILMNARSYELVKDQFLCRPIGKIQVKGKTEGVMTYEALAPIGAATPAQVRLAELTRDMVGAFTSGKFDKCVEAGNALESEFGPDKLVGVYRRMCEEYLLVAAPPDFDGQIVLTEK